jgi:hypothetical protein
MKLMASIANKFIQRTMILPEDWYWLQSYIKILFESMIWTNTLDNPINVD